MNGTKTILVAPLHWGLGHATRCIPIIQALLGTDYKVMLASDGAALLLLRKEFPALPYVSLPSYNITYPENGAFLKLKLLLKLPFFRKTMHSEKKVVEQLISEGKIHGIISDNRWGVRSTKVPSVFLTHQLNVLSGGTSYLSSKIHQKLIKKFDACWVPDVAGPENLSGKLGHLKSGSFPVNYIGVLSRMKKRKVPKVYDVLCLLSGPEPQRTRLEQRLVSVFNNSDLPAGKQEKKVLLVRGVVETEKKTTQIGTVELVNFLQSDELEKAINESICVVSRSGYTTIMDLTAMEKQAFFIPTPGQFEQEYLAKRLKKAGIVPSCNQKDFQEGQLNQIGDYKGLKSVNSPPDFKKLFRFFESEGKL
ncbi:glycosyltransferase [Marixanthomonas spongiae]|uniref:Glycosyltransferase n=1 Tax=Marixanthomonas spongiae TaxID=2174845 RepID=A0A2U0HZA7_9FLAO|nr:glycosyltransferase [Marixanthomonas spongiae]PVW14177.1 glycosyltransferase [Marixanthomonas spongiae]